MAWFNRSQKKTIESLSISAGIRNGFINEARVEEIIPGIVMPLVEPTVLSVVSEQLSPETATITRDIDGKIISIQKGDKNFVISRTAGSISSIHTETHNWEIKKVGGVISEVLVTEL